MDINQKRRPITLIEMLEKGIKVFPKKPAIIYQQERINYQELGELTNRLANRLLAEGIKKGERVGLLLNKTPEAIISFLGIIKAGGVVVPLNFKLPPPQLNSLIELTRLSLLLVDQNFVPLLNYFDLSNNLQKKIVIVQGKNDFFPSWEQFIADSTSEQPNISLGEDDLVYLNFTSGTTGQPKGALTTHAHIFWNTLSAVEALNLTCEDIHLCMFPVFVHPHEILARPLFLGGTMVLSDTVYPKELAKTINENGITCMMAVPPLYHSLLSLSGLSRINLDSLRIPESGGMVTLSPLASAFEKRFRRSIIPVWGSTETTGIAIASSPNEEQRMGAIGKPCPYYEIKVIDEEGQPAKSNEIGELIIRGPGVVEKYFGLRQAHQPILQMGWFYTRDLVRVDPEGYIFFVGRKDEMMKVAGLKVSPLEIEEVLHIHPQIAEAAVVSCPDNLHGEIPKAFIVVKPGEKLSRKEIRDFCRQHLASYKVPRLIEFCQELPRTASGKISRNSLKFSLHRH